MSTKKVTLKVSGQSLDLIELTGRVPKSGGEAPKYFGVKDIPDGDIKISDITGLAKAVTLPKAWTILRSGVNAGFLASHKAKLDLSETFNVTVSPTNRIKEAQAELVKLTNELSSIKPDKLAEHMTKMQVLAVEVTKLEAEKTKGAKTEDK